VTHVVFVILREMALNENLKKYIAKSLFIANLQLENKLNSVICLCLKYLAHT